MNVGDELMLGENAAVFIMSDILGVFAKFKKAAISCFLSVCPSAWSRWDRFSWN